MKGRKNGCPVNIKDWLIEIKDPAAVSESWVQIYGLTSMSRKISSDTEDASQTTDAWSENYVTKRSSTLTIEGKPVVVASTGAEDPGQNLLNWYAEQVGCEADATLRLTDPYGHRVVLDAIVTDANHDADDSEETVSWDLDQVGEAETLPYVSVTSIALKNDGTSVTTLSLEAGDAGEIITVDFTPATSSNKRFRVTNSNRNVVKIENITSSGFTVTPLAAGSSTVTVRTVNGDKTASLSVTVT